MTETVNDEQTPDPSWEVQKAIFARLKRELPNVTVVDNVEASEFVKTLPFVLIGDDTVMDEDNQVTNEYKVKAILKCHAEGMSRKAAKRLAHDVRQALKEPIEVEGFVNDEPISYHMGSHSILIEGIAQAVFVEWGFDLLEDIG